MPKKYVTLSISIFIALFTTLEVVGQNTEKKKKGFIPRYINSIINDTVAQKKSQFFIYPIAGYRPETGVEFGVCPLYVYYAKEDVENRLSEMNAYAFFTLNGQYGLRINHALYSDQDKWFFLGDLDFEQFPLKYYGIGNDVPKDNIALVNATQIRIKERVLRRVLDNFYIGLETDFRSLTNVTFEDFDEDISEENFDYPFGADGSTNFGLGLGLVYDERHNVLNTRDAFFSEFAYLNYNPFWDSKVEYQLITTDNRFFKKINERDVFAAQVLGEFNFDGDVPFNQLSYMGGSNTMRGYFKGRFRDRNQIATQIEYRFLPLKLGFTDRIGATVFTSVGEVFDDWNEIEMKNLKMGRRRRSEIFTFSAKRYFPSV